MDKKFLFAFIISCMALSACVSAQDASVDNGASSAPISEQATGEPADNQPQATPVEAAVPDTEVNMNAVPATEPAFEPAVEPVTPRANSVNTVVVQGTVTEIAADGSYVVINDGSKNEKFSTTKDFLDEAYMETGDKVKITGEKSGDIVKLIDYDYIFDDAYEPAMDDVEAPADAPVSAATTPSVDAATVQSSEPVSSSDAAVTTVQ